ncbi:MAG: recombinase family protein [Deltaproteobacteria bacterium]|nr:recombinase family protein [Deltaproteobacteria bacterium]
MPLIDERITLLHHCLVPTKTVAYLRVSTEKQADRGISLEAQRAKVEAYASLYDLDLIEVVVDAGASAKTLDRPGLVRALGLLRSRAADALLVVKLDRLTRSVRDLGDLVDQYFATNRWALLSVSEQIDTRSAAGRLVLNVLASVAQWEREATGERTSVALQHKAAQGEFIGGRAAPFGFRQSVDGVHLEAVAPEQAMIAEARRLRDAGLSLHQVAAELGGCGFRSRTNKPFLASQVARVIAA